MRRIVLLAILVTLCVGVIGDASPAVSVQIDSITPRKGKVGQTAVLHGSGLQGTIFIVKFGRANGANPQNPGKSDTAIKVEVPAKDPLDPTTVPVRVEIDGIFVGELPFTYEIPQPEPVITSFVPSVVSGAAPFSVDLHGSDFTTPQGRAPNVAYLVGISTNDLFEMAIEAVQVDFMIVVQHLTVPAALYEIVVGFTDGAAASAEPLEVTP